MDEFEKKNFGSKENILKMPKFLTDTRTIAVSQNIFAYSIF